MWSDRDLQPKLEEPIKIITPDQAEYLETEFEELLETYWTIFRVAPSIQIEYREAYLKKCAKYLREKLTFLKEDGNEIIRVTIKELQGLVLTKYDKSSIKVIVEYDGIEKYRGIFLSVGTKKVHDGVYLPLLLVHGEKRLTRIINKILAEILNCQITQYDMLQDYVWWIFSVFAQAVGDNSEKEIELEFRLPGISKNNEDGSISFYISCKHATTAWEKHCKKKNKIVDKNMSDFREEICGIAEKLFSVQISKLIFWAIRHNTFIMNGNKFKTNSVIVLCNVLLLLCQKIDYTIYSNDK